MPINVLCVQLIHDLFAIAKFLVLFLPKSIIVDDLRTFTLCCGWFAARFWFVNIIDM